jgi:hypothetical protein
LRFEDFGDGAINFSFDRAVLRLEVQQRNLHRRCISETPAGGKLEIPIAMACT